MMKPVDVGFLSMLKVGDIIRQENKVETSRAVFRAPLCFLLGFTLRH
jgi:hypothetical protein